MERSFLVVACLLRSLAHQFRNDLAVLNNELTYIKSLTSEGECDRAFAALKDLGDSLKVSELVSSGKLSSENILLTYLVEKLVSLNLIDKNNPTPDKDYSIKCDILRLTTVLKALLQLFSTITSSPINRECDAYTLILERINLSFAFKGVLRHMPESLKDSVVELSSFSALILNVLKIDSIWAAISDAVIWAHKGESRIILSPSGELTAKITIPIRSD